MHSFLITGKGDKNKEVGELAKKFNAKIFPFEVKKIADIKNLTSFTKLSLSEKTAVLINDFDKASEETQNAFLKNLEEPQKDLIYILTAQNSENILPTIISRCQVAEVQSAKKSKSSNSVVKVQSSNFIGLPVGKKLEYISKIKDREEAVEFITNLIYEAHEELVKGKKVSNFLENAQRTLSALKTNGNVTLQLTNFVVNIEN